MITLNSKVGFAIVALSLIGGASGCAMRSPLMKAPVVSQTMDSIDPKAKTEDLGPVSARYCPGETPSATSDPNDIGLLDEVIFRAQTSKDASYIRDANFMMEGNCVVLEGIAMKVAGAAPAAPAAPTTRNL